MKNFRVAGGHNIPIRGRVSFNRGRHTDGHTHFYYIRMWKKKDLSKSMEKFPTNVIFMFLTATWTVLSYFSFVTGDAGNKRGAAADEN